MTHWCSDPSCDDCAMDAKCPYAPWGYYCKRGYGHPGPCALVTRKWYRPIEWLRMRGWIL